MASLPCYQQANVDLQRGDGVFEKSIRALRIFNELGYGIDGGLPLTLVYNPVGATLPPEQDALEKAYKEELRANYGIEFHRLICITNVPITRFRTFLEKTGQLDGYGRLLVENFNPATVSGLMCRDTINVGWEGELYDCDFNQMIGLDLGRYLWDVGPADMDGDRIRTGPHCFGCTAGHGSSCGGTLA